jgi:hypothetical protein
MLLELTKITVTETEDFNSIKLVIKLKLLKEENSEIQYLFSTAYGISMERQFGIYEKSPYMDIINRNLCHEKNINKQYFVT